MSAYGFSLADVNMHLSTDTSRFSTGMVTFRKGMSEVRRATTRTQTRLESLNATIERTSASMVTFGKNMALTLSVPLGIITAMVVKTAGEFQMGMNRVRALTDATGASFNALREQALELGRTTQFTARDSAGAMGFLAQAGFEVNEILGSLPSTLHLAAAAQLDLATSADIVTNILAGFGKTVEELPHAVDILVKAFTSANTNLQQLAFAMKYVGPVAAGIGFTFKETAAAIALLGNAGIQATMAGTSLRGAITRLSKPSGEAYESMKRLGISVRDSRGSMLGLIPIVREIERAIARAGGQSAASGDLMTIFGARAGPGMLALVSQGSDALQELTDKFSNLSGYAQKVATIQMEGYIGALRRIQSTTEGAAISFGSRLIPAFVAVSDVIVKLNTNMINLNPATQGLVVWGTVFAVALFPAILGMALLVRAFHSLLKVRTWIAGFAVVALGVGAALASDWENAGPLLEKIWDRLKTSFRNFVREWAGDDALIAVDNLMKNVGDAWTGLTTSISSFQVPTSLAELKEQFQSIWDSLTIPEVATNMWTRLAAQWGPAITALDSTLVSAFGTLSSSVSNVINQMMLDWVGPARLARIQEATQWWIEAFTALGEKLGTAISFSFTNVLPKVIEAVKSFVNFIGEELLLVWQAIPAIWEGDTQRLSLVVNEFVEYGVRPLLRGLGDLIGTLVWNVWKGLAPAWTQDLSPARTAVSEFIRSVESAFDGLLKYVDEFVGKFKSAISPLTDAWESLSNLWSGGETASVLDTTKVLNDLDATSSKVTQLGDEFARQKQRIVEFSSELSQAGVGFGVGARGFQRTPEQNAAVGGNAQSSHLFGGAIDIDVDGIRSKIEMVKSLAQEGSLSVVEYGSHVHVQIEKEAKAALTSLYETTKMSYEKIKAVVKEKFGDDIPPLIQRSLQKMASQFEQFDDYIVGHSVWPDMWNSVVQETKQGGAANEAAVSQHLKNIKSGF